MTEEEERGIAMTFARSIHACRSNPLKVSAKAGVHGCIVLMAMANVTVHVASAQSANRGSDVQQQTTIASPWPLGGNGAMEADTLFKNYRFRDGETLPEVRIHYATLGTPHRDASGQIDNAVLVVHWTGSDGNALLSKNYMEALFALASHWTPYVIS